MTEFESSRDDDFEYGTHIEYYFDALGRRIAKKVGFIDDNDHGGCDRRRGIHRHEHSFTQSYNYFIDQDKVLMARAGDGDLSLYLDGQGIDEHFGEIRERKVRGYVVDHLGSVLNSPAAGGKKAFGAFGESLGARPRFLNRNTDPVMYGYTGRSLDVESGFYYLRNRMLDTRTGRFTSLDPIGFAGGDVNQYRYVQNHPGIFTDPTGLNSRLVFQIGHIALEVDDPTTQGGVVTIDLGPAATVSLYENFVKGISGNSVQGNVNIYSGSADFSFTLPFTTVTQTPAEDANLIARARSIQQDFSSGQLKYSFPGFSLEGDATNCAGFARSLQKP